MGVRRSAEEWGWRLDLLRHEQGWAFMLERVLGPHAAFTAYWPVSEELERVLTALWLRTREGLEVAETVVSHWWVLSERRLELRERVRRLTPAFLIELGLEGAGDLAERTLKDVAGLECRNLELAMEALWEVAQRVHWDRLAPPPDHVPYLRTAVVREMRRLRALYGTSAELGKLDLDDLEVHKRAASRLEPASRCTLTRIDLEDTEGPAPLFDEPAMVLLARLDRHTKSEPELAYLRALAAGEEKRAAARLVGLTWGQAVALEQRIRRHEAL